MRPRHADHIQLPRRHRKTRRRHIGNAGGVEGGQADLGLDPPRQIQMRRGFHPLNRDHIRHRRISVNPPPDDVDKIDKTRGFEPPRHLNALFHRQPAGRVLIGDIAHAKQELWPHPVAAGLQHVKGKAQAVIKAGGVIGASRHAIGQRADELVHQVAVAFKLHPIDTRRRHPLGGIGVILDHAGNIPIFHHLRESAVRRFARRPRRQNRQPIALVPPGAAAKMRKLDHHRRPRLMAVIGQALHPRNHLVLPDQKVGEHRRAVTAYRCRTRRHHHRHARLGALKVVKSVTIFWHTVFTIGRFMAGGHDAVAQRQMFQLIGLQKRIVGHGLSPRLAQDYGPRRASQS